MWVINIGTGKSQPIISLKDMPQAPNIPADRTSRKSSPCLLVDKRSYALGMPDGSLKGNQSSIAEKEHTGFVKLLEDCYCKTGLDSLRVLLAFLADMKDPTDLPWPSGKKPKANDLVTFQIGTTNAWLTDEPSIQKFWKAYIEKRLKNETQACVLCGRERAIPRILPFKVTLFGYSVQLSSFNENAFDSGGKTTATKGGEKRQSSNAPICFECAGMADQVLQFLLKLDSDPDDPKKERLSGRHAVVLTRDDSKGKQPLRNQIAVFWTNQPVQLSTPDTNTQSFLFEDLARIPLEDLDFSEIAPPPETQQMRSLMEVPFSGSTAGTELASKSFYLAILSPNKSRLVVREWLEYGVDKVRDHIVHYGQSLRIIHPAGRGIWYPPLRPMLEALRSYTSARREQDEKARLPHVAPDVTRKLVRCIYTGAPPPSSLLVRAVRCFRVPDPLADTKEQYERQMLRRMAMAAAMKYILTYEKPEKEQMAMEQLNTEYDAVSEYKTKAPYRCGQLLAILEAIQRRASSSGRGVNTTIVDRFYAAASTAPATVFANLLNITTKAHLPKLRRENKEMFKMRSSETVNINDLMADVCSRIDDAGGFPPPLTPEQQAQFALGFYHQRAEFGSSNYKEIIA